MGIGRPPVGASTVAGRRPHGRWLSRLLGPGSLVPVAGVAALVAVVYLRQTPAYDLDVYLRAARAVWHGVAVYPAVGSPDVYSGSAFVYPFTSLWPHLALAPLPDTVAMAVAYCVTVVAIVLAARAAGARAWPQLALVLLSSFVITGLQLGNLSPWLLVGALLLWRYRDRPWIFGLVAGPFIAAKFVLLPLLVWTLVTRRFKATAVAGAATLGLLALSFVSGPIGPRDYARILSALSDHEAANGIGLMSAFRRLGLGPVSAEAVALAVAAAVLTGAWLRYRALLDETIVYAGAIVAAILVTPVLWSHDLALLAAPLVARRASVATLAAFAAASWALAPPHRSSAWSIVAGLLLLAACAWRGTSTLIRTPPRRRLLLAAGPAAAAVALLVGLAGNPLATTWALSCWLGVAFAATVLFTSASSGAAGPASASL